MQASQIPTKFTIPFANTAAGEYINYPIPTNSQIGITGGAASLTDGFPPLTFVPTGAGGIPPFGADFNGLLKQITAWSRWMGAGGTVKYDSAFQTAVGGYPQGAIVASATTTALFWVSTVDNNMTNPDTGGSGWQSTVYGLAPLASPSFTGTPTAPTQGFADNSTKLATTAFVKQEGVQYSLTASIAASITLSPTNIGQYIFLVPAAAMTITLPDCTLTQDGGVLTFFHRGSYPVTVAAQSGQLIGVGPAFPASITLNTGDTLTLVNAYNGASSGIWYIQSGSAQLAYASGFASSLSTNGYQKLPSGLILQWGSGITSSGAVTITFPIAFPTAAKAINITEFQSGGWSSVDPTVYGTTYGLSPSTTQFVVNSLGWTGSVWHTQGSNFSWLAIGY